MPSARGNILPDVPVYYSPPQQSQSSQSSSQSQPQQSQPTQPTQPPTTTTPPQPDVDVQRSQPSRPKSSRIVGPTKRHTRRRPVSRPRRTKRARVNSRHPLPLPDVVIPPTPFKPKGLQGKALEKAAELEAKRWNARVPKPPQLQISPLLLNTGTKLNPGEETRALKAWYDRLRKEEERRIRAGNFWANLQAGLEANHPLFTIPRALGIDESPPVELSEAGNRPAYLLGAGWGIAANFALAELAGAGTALAGSRVLTTAARSQRLVRGASRIISPISRAISRVPGLSRSTRWLFTTRPGQAALFGAMEVPKAYTEYQHGYAPEDILLHVGRDAAFAAGFVHGFERMYPHTDFALERAKLEVGKKYARHEVPYRVAKTKRAQVYSLAKYREGMIPRAEGLSRGYSARRFVEAHLDQGDELLKLLRRQELSYSKFISPSGEEFIEVTTIPSERGIRVLGSQYIDDLMRVRTTPRFAVPEDWASRYYLTYARSGLDRNLVTGSVTLNPARSVEFVDDTLRVKLPEGQVRRLLNSYYKNYEFWTKYGPVGEGKPLIREAGTIRRFAGPDVQKGWAYEWWKGRAFVRGGQKLASPGEQYELFMRTGHADFKNPYLIDDETGYFERLFTRARRILARFKRSAPYVERIQPATLSDDVAENVDDLARYLEKWNGKKPRRIAAGRKAPSQGLLALQKQEPGIVEIVQRGTTRSDSAAKLLRAAYKALPKTPGVIPVVSPWVGTIRSNRESPPLKIPKTSSQKISQVIVDRPLFRVPGTRFWTDVRLPPRELRRVRHHYSQGETTVPEAKTLQGSPSQLVQVQREEYDEVPRFRQKDYVGTLTTRQGVKPAPLVIPVSTPTQKPEIGPAQPPAVAQLPPGTIPPTIPPVIPPTIPPAVPPFAPEKLDELPLGYGPGAPSGMFAYWIGATPFLGGDEEVIIIPRKPKTLEEKLFKEYFEWLLQQGFKPVIAARTARQLLRRLRLAQRQQRSRHSTLRNVPLRQQAMLQRQKAILSHTMSSRTLLNS